VSISATVISAAVCAALAAPLAAQEAGNVLTDCAECPEMVVVPAGRFTMGVAADEEDREMLGSTFRGRSEPRHVVEVKRFLAGRHEVTRGQYRAFTAATGRATEGCFVWLRDQFEKSSTRDWQNAGYHQDDSHPVVCVSWDDATAYTRWLSGRTGKPYRLLSEAEWEYAARAGSETTRFWGDDAHASCAYANGADISTLARVPGTSEWPIANCNDRQAYTAPVGSYRPNAFGLYDMLGNVWEWTQDCWYPDYAGAPTDGRAWLSGECARRVVRGGSWEDGPAGLRAAYRVGSPASVRVYIRGFRVARDD
jgi:formylglycine-generating enzyme required for sulfatase activity